jgi:hypothetical protein
MENYASAALSGMGYMLQQERNTNFVAQQQKQETFSTPMPSMDNVYHSEHWSKVRREEETAAQGMWNKSQSPMETGVVPRPAYADMFQPITQPSQQTAAVASAAGQPTHNNMQPFFGGRVRQNINPFANESRLEHYTGATNDQIHRRKEEVGCFFELTKDSGNVCGMQNNSDFYQGYLQTPVVRNNEFPIEQIRVGPGLNAGFTSNPSGGFQQGETLDFVRPKTVDELRPLSKPKTTFEIPFQGPQKGTQQRGLFQNMEKNRPDTYHEQSPDQWIKTTGAITKDMERPTQLLKAVARTDTHVHYEGAAQSTQPGIGDKDDYGLSTTCISENERSTTQTRTTVSNLTSIVKSIIAPFTDMLKRTPKEYTIDAARTFGTMQAQIPAKATLYDPVNHMMRTTIKETTIHDTTIMNLRGRDAVPVTSDDTAKTTNRETLPIEDSTRNVSAHTYKVIVYNPDSVAKTTHRETTSDNNNQAGYVGGDVGRKGAYTHIPITVYATQKQFISQNDHIGGAGSGIDHRGMSKEAAYNATIDGTKEAINIATGRTPTTQKHKMPFAKEGIDMESKKLVGDSMTQRDVSNISRVYQQGPKRVEACDATKYVNDLPNQDRLDSNILASLKDNPYQVHINPIIECK